MINNQLTDELITFLNIILTISDPHSYLFSEIIHKIFRGFHLKLFKMQDIIR